MQRGKINPKLKWSLLLAIILWAALLFLLFGRGTYADRPTEEDQTILASKLALKSTVRIGVDVTDHGSGFFFDRDRILTNWHVVEHANTVRIQYADKSECTGRVGYREEKLDLAIITGCKGTPLHLTNSFQTGESVLAIGNPTIFDFTVSKGIICGTQWDEIMTDAHVWNGSSGGPLVNMQGDVIGVMTEKSKEGLYGFAIQSKDILRFIERGK